MNFDLPVDKSSIIKVLGVGGGGGNAVSHMYKNGIKDVDFIVCNTDAQALENSPVPVKIQLGESLTEGRGAGNKPEIGRQAAIENMDDITKALSSNTKMIFITAGMGGGTGTGAAPIIAKQAKEMGILTVAIVTIPFRNEGQRRINQALEGIAMIEQYVDSLLVINNERIREMYGNLQISKAFAMADDVLSIAAKGIAEIITVHGHINVDFADVETVMQDSGVAIMGSAESVGEERALDAVKEALNSPLLNDNDIKGASNILINITSGSEEITMDETSQITDYVQDCAGQDADLIWGNGIDDSLEDKVCVTVIATGFSTKSIPGLYTKKKKLNKKPLSGNNSESNKHELIDKVDNNFNPDLLNNAKQGIIEFDMSFELEKEDSNVTENIEQPISEETEETINAYKKVSEIKSEHNELKKKSLNNVESQDDIDELENVPAFVRKKIKIKPKKHSEDTEESRFSLDDDGENRIKLSDNNPFLHDNVD